MCTLFTIVLINNKFEITFESNHYTQVTLKYPKSYNIFKVSLIKKSKKCLIVAKTPFFGDNFINLNEKY